MLQTAIDLKVWKLQFAKSETQKVTGQGMQKAGYEIQIMVDIASKCG
jgi:hypothetical protein